MEVNQAGLLQFINVVGSVLLLWLFYLIPSFVIAGPIIFSTLKKIKWCRYDFAMFLLPFGIWAYLMLAHGKGKGIGNLLEGLIIGFIIPLAPIIRLIIRDKMNQKDLALGLLVLLCLIAISLWAFMPGFPE